MASNVSIYFSSTKDGGIVDHLSGMTRVGCTFLVFFLYNRDMKRILPLTFLMFALLACNLPLLAQPAPEPTSTPALTELPTVASAETFTPLPTFTASPTGTNTPTLTVAPTATLTLTPTTTDTPGPTASPTFAFPSVTVNQQAHCRYGPSTAYLHAADLYAGDTGTVRGRFQYSKWLFIKFDKLNYFCWVAPSVVDMIGDITKIKYTEVFLPVPGVALYHPPQNVVATRNGKKVTITWERVKMTSDDDRGYFLELFVCQKGAYIWWTFSYPDQFTTSYSITDEKGCPAPSGGKLYTVEKHGYTKPVTIKWPQP
jgi:hypothetical protein